MRWPASELSLGASQTVKNCTLRFDQGGGLLGAMGCFRMWEEQLVGCGGGAVGEQVPDASWCLCRRDREALCLAFRKLCRGGSSLKECAFNVLPEVPLGLCTPYQGWGPGWPEAQGRAMRDSLATSQSRVHSEALASRLLSRLCLSPTQRGGSFQPPQKMCLQAFGYFPGGRAQDEAGLVLSFH